MDKRIKEFQLKSEVRTRFCRGTCFLCTSLNYESGVSLCICGQSDFCIDSTQTWAEMDTMH